MSAVETIRDARATLADLIPQLREGFQACWDILYNDSNRERTPRLLEPGEEQATRAPKCGSCEHPDDHDPGCTREGCRCRTWESMPSTVGWAEWTGPGKAEKHYTRATAELQEAHNAIFEVDAVPAKWSSSALDKPGSRTVPMRIDLVLHGVNLLKGALNYVTDDLAPPEANSLLKALEHAQAAVKQLGKAEDRIRDDEWGPLNRHRCAVYGCRVERHADGLCRSHYDANRRGARTMCLEHDLEIVMDTGMPDPRLVICTRCRRRWRLSRMNDSYASTG